LIVDRQSGGMVWTRGRHRSSPRVIGSVHWVIIAGMVHWFHEFRSAATVLVVGAIPIVCSGVAAADERTLAEEFWVPREALSVTEALLTPEFCGGTYRWPEFPHPDHISADEFPVEAQAARVQYWDSGEVILDGSVVVTQGNRTLLAPSLRLNHETREGEVPDRVEIREPDVILRGSSAVMNLDTRATSIETAEFLLPESEIRGTAARLSRDDDGNLLVMEGTFTRCEPGNRNWRIGSRSFDVQDGSDFGTARHAVVRVRNVPVFYTPYISFPINDERKSGWLFPSIGYSSQNGLEFAPPYYLNLAPNYDATITPRYFQKRGLGIEGEFRHLSEWQETTVVGSFLGEDKQFDGVFEKKDFERLQEAGLLEGPFEPADRWLYGMYHQGDLGHHWRTTVDYTAVSDRDYFRNLGTELSVAAQRELERRGELQYLNGGLDVRLWAQRFDRLDSVLVDPYQRLPELSVNYAGLSTGPLQWSFGGSAVSFDRKNEALSGTAKIVGDRVHLEPRVSLPLLRSWGFLTAGGGYRYTSYDLQDTADDVDDTPVRKIGFGTLDAGLFFERDLNVFGTSALQTLEPRVFYLYQQFADQDDLPRFDVSQLTFRYDQLWRDNRFSGIDRIGDANQLSVGLTSRLLRAHNGVEFLRASVGQIRYFEDREVTRTGNQGESDLASGSEVAGELVGTFGPVSVGGNIVWEPNDSQVNEGGGFVRYRTSNDRILHLGYRYRRSAAIDQTDAAVIWPLTKRWAAIGRWNYDLNSRRTIEGLAGIEYNDCCWQIRVIGRHYLDTPSARLFAEAETRTGVFLQIVFKGLAGLGGSVESLLARSVSGYQMEDL
jgi:LPS-assembly protein